MQKANENKINDFDPYQSVQTKNIQQQNSTSNLNKQDNDKLINLQTIQAKSIKQEEKLPQIIQQHSQSKLVNQSSDRKTDNQKTINSPKTQKDSLKQKKEHLNFKNKYFKQEQKILKDKLLQIEQQEQQITQKKIELTDSSFKFQNSRSSIHQIKEPIFEKLYKSKQNIPQGSHKVEMEMIRYLSKNKLNNEEAKSLLGEPFQIQLQQLRQDQKQRASSVINPQKQIKAKNIKEIKQIYLQNQDSRQNIQLSQKILKKQNNTIIINNLDLADTYKSTIGETNEKSRNISISHDILSNSANKVSQSQGPYDYYSYRDRTNQSLEKIQILRDQIKDKQSIDKKLRLASGVSQKKLDHRQIHITGQLDQTLPGPATYDVKSQIFIEKKPYLSTIQSQPMLSFGIKPNKYGYYHECYTDFVGKDSPPLNSYSPDKSKFYKQQPQYSISKQERFLQPSSVVKIQKQVPIQYSNVEFEQNLQNTGRRNQRNDLMGLGKRYAFEVSKYIKEIPGPGAYNSEKIASIDTVANKLKELSPSRLAFGVSKEQNDKLQYHGSESVFLGREGAHGPGGYDPEKTRNDLNHRNGSRVKGSLLSNYNFGFAQTKDDRGLLQNPEKYQQKLKTYNMSHHNIGPGSYTSKYGTIAEKYKIKDA